MLGSVIVAMVSLQGNMPSATQELVRFQTVAARPEWSMSDLNYLGASLTSQFDSVRNAALEFWPKHYPDAWEDFLFLNSYDYDKFEAFWPSFVEPGYNQLIKQQGSPKWFGAVRSLLKFGPEPGPRPTGCVIRSPRGTEWSETLFKAHFDTSPDFLRFVSDTDPLVCFNAVEQARDAGAFMKSELLKSWLESSRPERQWAAINNYETSTTAEWIEVTKLLLLSRDEGVRRAAIQDEYKERHDINKVLELALSLPAYAEGEATWLVVSNSDATYQQTRTYLKRQLKSSNPLSRLLAAGELTSVPGALSEAELLPLVEYSDLLSAGRAIEALKKKGIEPPVNWQDRLWKLQPSEQLDKATLNTAKPPPDWALKKYINAIETGSEGWFLEEEFAAIVSKSLPLTSWIDSGQPAKVRTALRMIPKDRVNSYSRQIQNLALSAEPETNELALSRAAQITVPAVRSQLFGMLSKLTGEARTQFREALCKIDDPVSRKFLVTWRSSSNREERMFARQKLYFLAHPLSDD